MASTPDGAQWAGNKEPLLIVASTTSKVPYAALVYAATRTHRRTVGPSNMGERVLGWGWRRRGPDAGLPAE